MSSSTGGTSGVGEAAAQAKDKAQETAQQAAGQARGMLRGQVDDRSTQAGQRVRSTASDVRTIGQQLREQGKDQPAKLADQAADRAERIGQYLEESDAERILHDVEDFGRRQPWAVIAGGLAVGFLASRMLKASSSRRSTGYDGGYGIPAPTSRYAAPRSFAGDELDPGSSDLMELDPPPVAPPRDIVVTGDAPGSSRGGGL